MARMRYRRKYGGRRTRYYKRRYKRSYGNKKSLKSSIKRRCNYAKSVMKKTQAEMRIFRPNYARRTFMNWKTTTFKLGTDLALSGVGGEGYIGSLNVTLNHFMSEADRLATKERFGLIHIHCLMLEVRVIGTQNMQRTSVSTSTNTKVNEGPSNFYDPNIVLFWDRQNYGSTELTEAAKKATKTHSLPGTQFLPMSGGSVFFKWEQPTYAKGKLHDFPSGSGSGSSSIDGLTNADLAQSPGGLYMIWLNADSYSKSSGGSPNDGATITLEIKGAMVADLTKQIQYKSN